MFDDISLSFSDIFVLLLTFSLVDPDRLDIWVVRHGMNQCHELSVSGELSRLYTVQATVSSVLLNTEIFQGRVRRATQGE